VTPRQLYEWAAVKIVTFEYCTPEDHDKERFRKAQILLGIQKIHCHSRIKNKTQTKVFSEANVFKATNRVHLQEWKTLEDL
jgi:hypothetical protein